MAEPGSPGGGSYESGDHSPGRSNVREQDRYLPIANISRIMKKALPANGKIAKDAKETVQECASEFISFITSEASDKCQREKRKTINGDDLLWAMATLGFEDYIDPLKIYLARYRDMEVSALFLLFLLHHHYCPLLVCLFVFSFVSAKKKFFSFVDVSYFNALPSFSRGTLRVQPKLVIHLEGKILLGASTVKMLSLHIKVLSLKALSIQALRANI